ncbi:hypothetical protein ARMGADRAFT_1033785 [Armillaria gallica]|uniref:Uncharacterized protein n=1 Tax=Armillaria gallica TaxID=47427 RepID=A0A2H3D4U6_ARMGA|nr:hypothetical protein ARMGADRAFT_1033785 [Armillaria gallica]
MSTQGTPLNNSLPTEPDARVLQNCSKNQSYYWHYQETILRNQATQYAEKKHIRKDNSMQTKSPLPHWKRFLLQLTKEKEKLSDKTTLTFWVQHRETLALHMQDLIDQALLPEVTLSDSQLDALQTITDLIVQYIKQLYLCFYFIFRHDEDYHEEDSLIFQARAEEMEALLTQINSCSNAILNIAGYGKEYKRVNSLAAKAFMISSWVLELEIEALDDPNGLI